MSIAADPVVAFTRRRVMILAGVFVAGVLVVVIPMVVLLSIATFDGRSTESDFIRSGILFAIAPGALAVAITCTRFSAAIGRGFTQANPSARSRYKSIRGAVTGGKPTQVQDQDAQLAVAYARYSVELLPISILQFFAFYVSLALIGLLELQVAHESDVLFVATEVLLGFAVVAAVLSVTFTLRSLRNARRFLANPSPELLTA
jgi:hypothetical protein